MKRILYPILFASLLLTGCGGSAGTASSSTSSSQTSRVSPSMANSSTSSASSVTSTVNSSETSLAHTSASDTSTATAATNAASSLTSPTQVKKMVIYNADLTLQVKDFSSAQSKIEQLANDAGGYVLDSTVSDTDQTNRAGKLTLRIPSQKFETFLNDVAKVSTKVVSRTVTGEDVTEQYVDLESTLRAKQQVEDRLSSFMQNAKTTDDLLKISNNLAQVQQDIETIKGKMKYLEVNSELSKVTINISENPTAVSSSKRVDTSVWGKTKGFFVDNVNGLAAIVAQLFIFLIGASPTLICLAVVAWGIYSIRKKRRERLQNKESQDRDPPSSGTPIS